MYNISITAPLVYFLSKKSKKTHDIQWSRLNYSGYDSRTVCASRTSQQVNRNKQVGIQSQGTIEMYLFIRTSFSRPEARDELVSSCLGHGLNHKVDKGVDVRLPVVGQLNHPHWIKNRYIQTVAGTLVPAHGGYRRWGRRLESWPNTAARLAGWNEWPS